jgi:hypothetical protein
MRQISPDILSIGLEVPFVPPLTRSAANLDAFAGWLCEKEKGLGLRSEQVRLKSWDDLFAYELQAHFFGDNGLITRTADKIRLEIKNARTAGDWEVVRQIIVRFYQHMRFPAESLTTFSAYVHSQMPSAAEVDGYFAMHSLPQLSARPALFQYVKIVDWEADVRVLVEKSNAFPSGRGLFVGWETQFANNQDWETFIGTLPTVMENSAHYFDLGLLRSDPR